MIVIVSLDKVVGELFPPNHPINLPKLTITNHTYFNINPLLHSITLVIKVIGYK